MRQHPLGSIPDDCTCFRQRRVAFMPQGRQLQRQLQRRGAWRCQTLLEDFFDPNIFNKTPP